MSRLTNDQKKFQLGMLGERLICNFLRKRGNEVEESLSTFDNKKDLIVNGHNCEVKTQIPYLKYDMFTFKKNQIKKCKNAHFLFFVEVPHKDGQNLKLWVSRPGRVIKSVPLNNGKLMYGVTRSSLQYMTEVDDFALIQEARSLSSSIHGI